MCKITTLAHPASVDTVPTSARREDHVSMRLGAARDPGTLTPVHARVRDTMATLGAGRVLSGDIEAIASLIETGTLGHACAMEVK